MAATQKDGPDAAPGSAVARRPLEAPGDAVIVTDLEGRITSWNRGAELLYGWRATEALGRNVIEVTPSDLSREQARQIMALLARGETWQGQFVVKRRDGTPFVARVTDAPLFDGRGEVVGVIGVSQDAGAVEGAIRHLAYLAEASRLLGASLDYGRTLRDVARVLVPGFADVCSVFVDEGAGRERAAEAALDESTEACVRGLREIETPVVAQELFDEVTRTGRARLVEDYAAHVLATKPDTAYGATIRKLDVASALVAPIVARGKTIGVFALGILRRSKKRFDANDVSFAEELAHRVGLAIDNARLYRNAEAARLAVEQREASLVEERRIFETLYRIGTSLANELDEQTLIQRVTDEARALTGADFGSFVFAPTFRAEGVFRCDDVRKDPRYPLWGAEPVEHLPVVSCLAVPVITRTGEVLGGLFFAHRDVGRFTSEHERIVVGFAGQAAIALENARLYAQLKASEAQAKEAFAIAHDAERRKDEFLAMLGHELRNPLAPIVTALELMRMRGDASREAQIIERQVGHLVRLVDDLLDVARITRGKVELKRSRMEMAQVVARAVEIASPLIEQRSHHLSVDVPTAGLLVDGDPTRLAQIVSNLLANAAKYTDPRGHIDVTARAEGSMAMVAVRDDGTGIDPAVLPTIFQPFVQSPQALDRAQGGLGIGLTLVRSLVEIHGGSVEAKSAGLGKGTEVIIRVPLALAYEAAAPVTVAPRTPPRTIEEPPLRVLVVDDNSDAAEMLSEALRALGHVVETAEDGPTALRLADRFHPQVAVLDIGLPVMDGYELAERLRSNDSDGESPRLIAVTGYGQAEDRARGVEVGFDAHLVKPIDLRALARTIASVRPR